MTAKTTRMLSYRDAINEALQQEMEHGHRRGCSGRSYRGGTHVL